MTTPARIQCRQCNGAGFKTTEYSKERCHHCEARGYITDPEFYAMLNAPLLHPITGQDCATHARQP